LFRKKQAEGYLGRRFNKKWNKHSNKLLLSAIKGKALYHEIADACMNE